MNTRSILFATCILASASLATGIIMRGFNAGGAFVIFLGLFWLLSLQRRWEWASPILFSLFGFCNVIAVFILAIPYLELISISAALVTWDLDHFLTRIERIRSKEMTRRVETSHLQRLMASAGAGIVFSALAMLIHIQLNFTVAMISGILVLLALVQVINRLGHREAFPVKPDQSLKP